MAAQEQPVEESCLSLGRQGIEIVSRRHNSLSENVSIAVGIGFDQVLFSLATIDRENRMPTLLSQPVRVRAAGNKPKLIDEYIGRLSSKDEAVSVAHMRSPGGWQEPGQTPEFDEFTVVLHGMLRVEHRDGSIEVREGQAVIAHKGEWVRYGTPEPEGAEYIAVCLPAFSMETVHRDAE
jgi:mannose-6-phosphate isomerase-like protein (cupin superfamily)